MTLVKVEKIESEGRREKEMEDRDKIDRVEGEERDRW